MRYTRIEVAGEPGRTALLTRREGDEYIAIDITTPTGPHCFVSVAASAEDRRGMAVILQKHVDGFAGCQGDIAPYANLLDLIADQ